MEDHLLAVQFILIQSGGRAEQRVNAANIDICSPRPGDAHIDTPCTFCFYENGHTLLRKHLHLLLGTHPLQFSGSILTREFCKSLTTDSNLVQRRERL